ncbi:MAG: hypothetical protein R2716_11560 [Microthrixaceae bacterium]
MPDERARLERLARLLEADGYVRASTSDADVIVLNTCCIREGCDTKLYGTLGHLKALRRVASAEERGSRSWSRLPGAEGPRTAARQRPARGRGARHPNVRRAAELLAEHRDSGRPVIEILESTVASDHEQFPSALPVVREQEWAAWATIQVGCDNNCAFCIVPAVRGPEASRAFGEVLGDPRGRGRWGHRGDPAGPERLNSYGRDLTLAARATARNPGVRARALRPGSAGWRKLPGSVRSSRTC